MDVPILIYSQLLATKFFIPVSPHSLISRPRLTTLLDKSLRYPLTLLSAPAGFGKTMLLSGWAQSLPTSTASVAWVSLDDGDNEPQQFWTYLLSSLDQQNPDLFTPLLKYLQSPQTPPLTQIITLLINLLADSTSSFILILDDYHVITEPQIHTTLSYLIEHLPSQMHIILATRTDPTLPLSQWRAHGQILEIRTDQLRCTPKETSTFFKETKGIQFSNEMIQIMTDRTEGWLVGLQLLALSLQECEDPINLLDEVSGDQRYILDFLTEEVLQRQPQEVQTFLLSTCILDCLTAPLCDAVTKQTNSQQILQRLEQTNLFVVSLDLKRQCYRYHALFAQALNNLLERSHPDLALTLHYRASLWYAEHHQNTQAILHAFSAHQWQWAADLIEHLPLLAFGWGASEHELVLLRQWLEQLPTDIVHSRPRLCLASAQLLWTVAPSAMEDVWLDTAEATLKASLSTHIHEDASDSTFALQTRQEQENLLGEIIATRAFLQSFQENGEVALSLCQHSLATLPIENSTVRMLTVYAQIRAFYASSINDAQSAAQTGLQARSLAHAVGNTSFEIVAVGTTALYMLATGQLHEIYQLTQQAILAGTKPEGLVIPDIGWAMLWQADVLREWNQLDSALKLVEEAISLCKQATSINALVYILCGYAMLLRVHLSLGNLDAAHSALKEFERISTSMNQHVYRHMRSLFTTVDQVRLWLVRGELDRATNWIENIDIREPYGTPFANERQEVVQVRIFLAKKLPNLALQRLEPVLQRATTGQRWSHVIEVRLLQALAYQMLQEEIQALNALSEAIRLAEPEGFVCSFVDEGPPMAILLDRLQQEQRKIGPTPYLDTLLAAFAKQNKAQKRQPKRTQQRRKRPVLHNETSCII